MRLKLRALVARAKNKGKKGWLVLVGLPLLLLFGGGAAAFYLGASNGPSASNQTGSINLNKGLIGYWNFNGNANDQTPYGNNGAVNGAALTTDRHGKASSAYSFTSSSSNYINIPVPSVINNNTIVSVSAWIKTTSSATQIIFSAWHGGGAGYQLLTTSGKLAAWSNGATTVSNIVVNDNNWHHLVAVWSGTTVTMYSDGVASSPVAKSIVAAGSFDAQIGTQCSPTCSAYFNGSIDDVRVYNRVLSAAEVTALYNQYDSSSKFDQGENGLVGWWKMQGNAKDSTPYARDATYNGATLTSDREGRANSAYSFNGTSTSYIHLPGLGAISHTSNYSISLWLETNSSATQTVLEATPNCSDRNVINLNSTINFGYYDGTSWHGASSNTSFATGQWYHVVATDQAGTVHLYVNGVLQTGTANPYGDCDNLRLGGTQSNGYYFNGSMSDLRVYNRVLSQSDVTNLYNSYNSEIGIGGVPGSTVNLGKGLVGEWDLNGNAYDSTPYADNGTVTSATLTSDREGRANSAYSFNGSTSGVQIGDNTPLKSMSALSISAWINPTVTTGSQDIIQKENSYNFRIASSNLQGWITTTGGYINVAAIPINNVPAGQWTHVVFTWQSGNIGKLYVNGVDKSATGTSASGSVNNNTNYVSIGKRLTTEFFNGSIDDVRIWNRVLSPTEVTALYNEYK